MFENFLRPLTTGDVWWQDGQIKEEEETTCNGRYNDPYKHSTSTLQLSTLTSLRQLSSA